MLRFHKTVFSVLIVFALALAAVSPGDAFEDAIIAVVNDDIITLKDFKDYIQSLLAQLKMEGRRDSELREIMREMERDGISRLIEDKLILSEANRIGLEVRPEVIDQRLADIRRSYRSEQDFLNALLAERVTISELKKKLNDQLKIKFMVEREVKSKVVVNPQEVTEYYKKNFESFQKPARVELLSIYIPKQDDPDAAREQAKDVLLKIIQGADFQFLASTYSQGAPIRTIEKGQALPAIETAVFGLREGEVSKIIELDDGLYIFKAITHVPEKIVTLDEVKTVIAEKVFQDKFRQTFNTWIQDLRKQAYIDIKG